MFLICTLVVCAVQFAALCVLHRHAHNVFDRVNDAIDRLDTNVSDRFDRVNDAIDRVN